MKSGVWEVVGSIPTSMAEWTKALELLVHEAVWCVGGHGFEPQPGQYTWGGKDALLDLCRIILTVGKH